ncbi:type VII secretion protein EccB [Cellulomonas sp. APG4]|uniref:type VII secretion protein EccB n=1 Tax=Cellulomonas sp. APG4 TaxID=1538656 RepID=UPI00137B03BF|nr:type VII secretion protein EccB [Cellulomonas sp. APG4]
MATKKDLVEAQTFSRRRLLTAFVSGAPGGRELEPGKPLRAVVGGVTLSVLLVLGSLGFGLLRPTLPQGWDHNSLVVTDTGARYLAVEGTLHPVLNTTSARLLIPSGEFQVVSVDDARIADSPRGAPLGIPGAPDDLAPPERLVATGWLACTASGAGERLELWHDGVGGRLAAQLAADDAVGAADDEPRAALVDVAGDLFLVVGGRHHRLPRAGSDAVLRALGLEAVPAWPVSARWLNLFAPGTELGPLELGAAGDPLPAGSGAPPGATVGTVVAVTDGTGERYVIDAAGELAPLTTVSERLYRLGSGAEVLDVTAAQIAGMATSEEAVTPGDWPVTLPAPLPQEDAACALLRTGADGGVRLVGTPDVEVPQQGTDVSVQPATGALIRVAGSDGVPGYVQVVDQAGTAFAVPGADDEVLARLGYTADDVTRVPPAWAALLPVGPELSEAAALGSDA